MLRSEVVAGGGRSTSWEGMAGSHKSKHYDKDYCHFVRNEQAGYTTVYAAACGLRESRLMWGLMDSVLYESPVDRFTHVSPKIGSLALNI